MDMGSTGVIMAIDKLKKYKASGPEGIPAELIKSGGEKLLEKIHRLLSIIWVNEALPNEWKESIIVTIYKKGGKTGCNNYRGISLLSTSYSCTRTKFNFYEKLSRRSYQAADVL